MDLQKLLNEINAKKAAVQQLVAENKIEEAKQAKDELVAMQAKYDLLADLVDNGALPAPAGATPIEKPLDAIHEFANAARRRFVDTTNNEGTGSAGGYTVPADIQTKINTYKEAKFSLQSLVDVEPVTTNTGRRTYQTKAQHTGFTNVNEGGAIGAKTGPAFGILNYAIKKYAGYLPVTNELLEDSDANIANTLIQWLGDEDIATRNALIIAKLKAATHTATINGIDDIKTAVNVTLGSAYAGGIAIVTNDDGFNWMDQLKKTPNSNEYLLKPAQDQTSPWKHELAVGATRVPVIVIPNAVLASTVAENRTAIPFFIGDAKEYVKLFDRKLLTIMRSTEASVGSGANAINAFEQDMTIFRGITRLDAEIKDTDAMVYGTLTLGE